MKRCPYCAEEIQDAAIVCKHCGRDLGALPPPPPVASTSQPPPPPPAVNRPTLAPATPLRTRLIWAGVVCLVISVAVAALGGRGWTFLVLWIGAALLLNRLPTKGWFFGGLGVAWLATLLLAPVFKWTEARRAKAEQIAAKETADRNRAQRLQQLEKELPELVAAKSWEAAAKGRAELKNINPHHPALAAGPLIDGELQSYRVKRAEEDRARKLADGLAQAKKVSADKTLCDTPKAIADAWNLLRVAKRSDPQWGQATAAVAGLEACRLTIDRTLSRGMQQLMITQREATAQRMERTMLDQGMEVDFRVSGAKKDQLTVKWVLMSKAAVHQLTKGGSMAEGSVLSTMQKVGFKRVHFKDGYDYAVYYDLEPPDETKGGTTVLAANGLGAPLRLQ